MEASTGNNSTQVENSGLDRFEAWASTGGFLGCRNKGLIDTVVGLRANQVLQLV